MTEEKDAEVSDKKSGIQAWRLRDREFLTFCSFDHTSLAVFL